MPGSFVAKSAQFEGTVAGQVMPITYPAGVQAGDTAVLVYAASSAAVPRDQSAIGFTTWFAHSSTSDTVLPNLYVGYHVCDGSESSTTVNVDAVNSAHLGVIMVFRGVNPLAAVLGAWVQQASAVGTLVLTGVTMPATGSILIASGALNSTAATTTPPSTPAAFTEAMDRTTGVRTASTAYLPWSGSGASGNATFTWSGSARSMGILIGIPATVAPANTGRFFQFL